MNVDDFEIILYEEPVGHTALVAYCGEFLGSRFDLDPLVAQYKALCALEGYLDARKKETKKTIKIVKGARENME